MCYVDISIPYKGCKHSVVQTYTNKKTSKIGLTKQKTILEYWGQEGYEKSVSSSLVKVQIILSWTKGFVSLL